ncbi:MAG TPA: efflux RND transporter permease subunit [Oligoflexia bacterium]|nr:efflux RND transporter permease subunit [Oligoflexia bacterium]HMP47782.1 efflux RND transporter permease subunit [Oligoflexia bacterium]
MHQFEDLKESEEINNKTGIIAWFVKNKVSANLLMLVFIIGGLILSTQVTQEVFPEFTDDSVTISVLYPGASPEEVEQGIILVIEEAIRSVDGIKQISSLANEGLGTVTAEIIQGADQSRVYLDIQQEIDRIRSFPLDAEEPGVSLIVRKREVLEIQIYGNTTEWILRELAEQTREALLQHPDISQVELTGARKFEVEVSVSRANLRKYNITPQIIAERIGSSGIELPAGSIETKGGKILLRFADRLNWAHEFRELPIITTPEGGKVLLGDIASVVDTFEDVEQSATYNGLPAIGLTVFRVGKETPFGVAKGGRNVLSEIGDTFPPGIQYVINKDQSIIYQQRINLLLKNAALGLVFVMLILTLFLDRNLAFWVTLGIPTSFLGAFLFFPILGVTINMISLFAFIIALGIVVDDAIVAGENIHEYRTKCSNSLVAAIDGAKNIAVPVSFSIITNIVAFVPLLFIPGMMGKFWQVIPFVVISIFIVSWIESLWILPSHLGEKRRPSTIPVLIKFDRFQQIISKSLSDLIENHYYPFVCWSVTQRYLCLATSFLVLSLVSGYALSGRLGFELMPKVEADSAFVTAVLPVTSPREKVAEVRATLVSAAERVASRNGDEKLYMGSFATINGTTVEVNMYLTDPEIRPISTAQVTDLWREEVGQIAGVQSLRFEADRGGPSRGAALTVELSHRDTEILNTAGRKLAEFLSSYNIINDIDDGYASGRSQIDIALNDEGRRAGLTSSFLARQLRDNFFGAEALRQQRGRNEVRVIVRLPIEERSSEFFIENMIVRTPSGAEVPLNHVAELTQGRAYTAITRRNAQRTLTVSANVNPQSEANNVISDLKKTILPELVNDYPGLSYSFEGRHADMRDSMNTMVNGLLFSLVVIYVLLAVPFKSYFQPLIIMGAIPFGIIGAIIGHFLMGYSMSIISMMGIVALTGVVVNDSLVIIDYANQRRISGDLPFTAITTAATRRFRPILLTTLTTFCGLGPMIFETSRQARFLIPMAISLGFGIVFATAILLIVVPCLYMVLEDVKKILKILK